MQNIAVILAGGTGTRFGCDIPKQFMKIGGVEIIRLAVKLFAERNEISRIIVVSIDKYIPHVRHLLQDYNNIHVISGGKTRTQSSFNALKFINEQGWNDSCIFIHDAARPFVANNNITNIISAAQQYKAVLLALPSSNTLYYVKNSIIELTLNRDDVFQAQTPQAFHFETIFSCYNKMSKDEYFTDDASVVLKYSDVPVHIVYGDTGNNKITYKEDLNPEI